MRQFLPVIAISRLLAVLALLGLSGCTSLAPFETVTPGVKPPPPVQSNSAIPVFTPATTTISNAAMAGGQAAPPAGTGATVAEVPAQSAPPAAAAAASAVHPLAICYNRLTASPEQVRSTAEAACPGGALRFVGQGWNLNFCPLFTPVRAVFTCTTP